MAYGDSDIALDPNGVPVETEQMRYLEGFGELVTGYSELATRYQYAGGWGYETGGFGDDPGLLVLNGAPGTTPIRLQHVGFRWYDPAIGRFVQRDPIGIEGGFNVYAYVSGNPLTYTDPSGLIGFEMGTSWPPDANKSQEEREGERKVSGAALQGGGFVILGGWAGGIRGAIAACVAWLWGKATNKW